MTSANEDQNTVASAKTDSETSANKYPENPAVDESVKTSLEDKRQDEGEVALDPHPSQALRELVTGDESSSKDA